MILTQLQRCKMGSEEQIKLQMVHRMAAVLCARLDARRVTLRIASILAAKQTAAGLAWQGRLLPH
jgi:hypothetical protein